MGRPRSHVLALVVGGLAVLALGGCSDEPTAEDALRDAGAGDCLAVPEELNDDYEIAPCDEAADYEILTTVAEEPTEDAPRPCDDAQADNYEQSFDFALSLTQGDPFTLCLQQLPEEGDCVAGGRYLACEDGGGAIVDAVLSDTIDPADCPAPSSHNRVYQEDQVVVCLSPNPVS